MNEKVIALLEDAAFAEKIALAENADAVRKLFADHGADISDAELSGIATALTIAANQGGDELSEAELEQAAGGTVQTDVLLVDPKYFKPCAPVIPQISGGKWWSEYINSVAQSLREKL